MSLDALVSRIPQIVALLPPERHHDQASWRVVALLDLLRETPLFCPQSRHLCFLMDTCHKNYFDSFTIQSTKIKILRINLIVQLFNFYCFKQRYKKTISFLGFPCQSWCCQTIVARLERFGQQIHGQHPKDSQKFLRRQNSHRRHLRQ